MALPDIRHGSSSSKEKTCDFPLDISLLPATVSGKKGIDAMKAIVRAYIDNRLGAKGLTLQP